jgi:hypothetical protein
MACTNIVLSASRLAIRVMIMQCRRGATRDLGVRRGLAQRDMGCLRAQPRFFILDVLEETPDIRPRYNPNAGF